MSVKIKKLEISPAFKQEGKSVYLPPEKLGRPIYTYDREKDLLKEDDEIWDEGIAASEVFFLQFFTGAWSYGAARNRYRKEVQTKLTERIPKEEWGKQIELIKEVVVSDWKSSVKDISVEVTKPGFGLLDPGSYEVTFVIYSNQYDGDLRMVFTAEFEIRVEVIVPVGKYEYYELLSIVIRAIKDKFPFRASHKRIRELREAGRVIRYRDPITERIRWRPRIEIPLGAYSLDDLVNIIGKRIGEKSPYTEARHGIIPELIETGVITRFREPITKRIRYRL